ncbi:MAG: NUDIX hydrolase [Cyanobacteriota bacterium]
MVKYTETTISSEIIYQGKIVSLKRDFAKLVDGQEKLREVVIHPGGVVVAAFTENNELLLVKQYRYPAQEELIELPAGKLEPGENPDEAIKRELEEECGFMAEYWEKLAAVYATPGFCTEKLHLYKAHGLIPTKRNLDDGEFLDYFSLPVREVWNLVVEGKIKDAKSVALLGLVGANKY